MGNLERERALATKACRHSVQKNERTGLASRFTKTSQRYRLCTVWALKLEARSQVPCVREALAPVQDNGSIAAPLTPKNPPRPAK